MYISQIFSVATNTAEMSLSTTKHKFYDPISTNKCVNPLYSSVDIA